MITSYFGSDICSLCQNKCKAQGRSLAVVCGDCQKDRARATQTATLLLNHIQRAAHAVSKECSRCNHCFEDAATFADVERDTNSSKSSSKGQASTIMFGKGSATSAATSLVMPIANCVCIDCPITFERHRLREREIESIAVCKALDLF
jgi:hypothetical protein